MTDEPYPSLYDMAIDLHAAGMCVLPAAEDGSKRPAVDWKRYQSERPGADQLRAWFADGTRTGLGVVAGAVSGGIELTEIEGRAMADGALVKLRAAVTEAGEDDLWARLVPGGYVVQSPAGGLHIITRLVGAPVPGNTKLAATAGHVTLAETRGEGGWFITAPSHGRVHPTFRPWVLVTGAGRPIPEVTPDERERFHALLRTLDERPAPAPVVPATFAPLSRPGGTDGVSPGDDYTERTTWDEVLTADGWRRAFARGEVTHWTRPGKTQGISATTGYQGDWLYVFTSSTVLEPERTYTRFGYRAAWDHGGDHQAAAKALQAQGFGKAPTVVQLPVPRPAPDAPDRLITTAQAEPVAEVEPLTQAFGLTDTGNAKLLVARFGHRLRYCPERGAWLRREGHRWAWDEAGEHIELAKAVLEDAARGADDKAAAQHFQRSLSRRGVEAAVALARTDPSVAAPINALDADPGLLCTPGGIVNLRTGVLRPATADELHTRSTLVTPDPACPTPRWAKFLTDTYGDDDELVGYMQRLLGYCTTGEVGAHVLPFLYGATGANGKSVLVEVVRTLLAGYATTAPGTFLTQGPTQHETEIARLHGARFVGCSETEDGARFAEAKIKMLTGGDAITARFLRRDHFTYTPTAKLMLMANHRPSVNAGGTSFWRRVRLINHPFQVPVADRIDGLAQLMVDAEGPGILAWLVAGARAFYAQGLEPTPASVRAATAEYAADEDDLGRFVSERLILASTEEARAQILTPTTTVTSAYRSWCAEEGIEPVSLKRLGMELRARLGVEVHRAGGNRFYRGLTLTGVSTFTALTPLHLN